MLTVTTPASTADLTTLAVVKAELGLTSNEHDTQLATYITQASDRVESFCNRTFAQESISETFRLDHRENELVLTRFPVTAITSVVENGASLATSDYELDADSGVLRRLQSDTKTRWPCGKIVVEYVCGYLLPGDVGRDLPRDIERAAILLVKQFASNSDRDLMTKRETTEGVRTTEYFYGGETGLPPEVEGLLIPHRKPSVG